MDADAAAWLERLDLFRRSVDLRLDAEGGWWHEGAPVTHPRLIALFDQGLDVHAETGEAILRVGEKWCYVRAEGGTPFRVRRLTPDGDDLSATLNNGECWPVPPAAFAAIGDHVYVTLAPHRRARLDRGTQSRLAEWLVEGADGALWVEVGGRRWPVPFSPEAPEAGQSG